MISRIHQEFIDKSIETLKKDSRIAGLCAGGSYITNSMDEFSDIDLIITVNAKDFEQVMKERYEIAGKLGNLLSAFTGEHVGEPRLIIALYGPPILHVDLKFVSLEDVADRVEDPAILWERENLISNKLKLKEANFPTPDLQWIEDRFWVWVHYGATKIGRKEIFETIDFISFMRQSVIGPLTLMKNNKLPRGVRKIEVDAPNDIALLIQTIPSYDVQSCIKSLHVIIDMYIELREHFKTDKFEQRSEAQRYALQYLNEIEVNLNI